MDTDIGLMVEQGFVYFAGEKIIGNGCVGERGCQVLPKLPFDRVIFTSSTTVRAYFENFPEERTASRTWIAVGTSTLDQLNALDCPGELLEDEA